MDELNGPRICQAIRANQSYEDEDQTGGESVVCLLITWAASSTIPSNEVQLSLLPDLLNLCPPCRFVQ